MVKLEAIEDEHFVSPQAGPPADEDDGNYTDTDSSISSSSDVEDGSSDTDSISNETLGERLAALQDIVPPSQRRRISTATSRGWSWVRSGLRFSGNAAWYLSASALFFVVPTTLAFLEDAQMQEMEREMKIQQGINEVVTPEMGAKAAT